MPLVDFQSDFETVRQAINLWVGKRTRDLITEFIPEDVLPPLTRFVLVNAIYFYDSWNNAFNPDLTEDEPFYLTDGTSVDVPLMRQNHQFGHFADQTKTARKMRTALMFCGGATVSHEYFLNLEPPPDL